MIERVKRDGTPTISPRDHEAFSLIELLVVIAIIGLLAGILLGVMPGVMHRKVMSRVETELKQLEAAIEYYKEKQGFYPPDNTNDFTRPPLFYELVGTRNDGALYFPLNGEPSITKAQMASLFSSDGFLNSSAEESDVKNFCPKGRRNQYMAHPTTTNVMFFAVPTKGPGGEFNPWRYIVAKPNPRPNDPFPTNNPNSFDLWAEIVHGGRTHVIGNWKK
jgi:prepilin-type N-terminal cleavage/methylation domain-containing protein